MAELPEWLEIADLHTMRDYYTQLRKGMRLRYFLWTLGYALLFFGVGLGYLPWQRAALASLVSLLCPLAGVIDWIWTTHRIEQYSARIAATGVNLRI
jgi:hypothetical protein